jgi:transposase
MAFATLLTGPERRRRWVEDERRRIVAAAFAPGAVVTRVARENEVSTSLIYKWREQSRCAVGGVMFVPAVVSGEPPHLAEALGQRAKASTITVEFADGARVSIGANASPALVTATPRALRS